MIEKNFKYIFGIGCLSHALNFNLEALTLRNDIEFWIYLIIPSIIAFIFLLKDLNILNDDEYKDLEGIKLKLYKAFICLVLLSGSVFMFGGYLNNIALGTNYLFCDKEILTEEFQVLEVTSTTTGTKRRKKRVPLLIIKNGELIDEVGVSGIEYKDFDQNPEKITLSFKRGFWGWGVLVAD